VKNGTLGTVLAVEAGGERLTVRLDGSGGPVGKAGQVVTFYTKDYGHLDHGYAATIHKAQGVTVDRAHVLATPYLDRHAAYVGLTRHRDAVTLHYGRDDFAEPARLARTLGRERTKDTTLDYDRDDLARRYAERRGLDPLRPESEIVVRTPERQDERATEAPTPRRSRFAGLKLKADPANPVRHSVDRPQERAEPVPVREPPRRATPEREREERLRGALTSYVEAWADAGRMTAAGLPVLAHQAEAMERSGQALEALAPHLLRDTRAALERAPELVRDTGTAEGMAALGAATGAERRARLDLDERGRAAVRTWNTLERAYTAAEKGYDWQAKREVAERMEAFATELKRDPQLDSLLRQRGRALGVDEGSRLDHVVQAREADISRTLRRDLGISLGRGMGMGM
jgi:hypothetical protein